jgi:co-chaperonin GroES (HSP10)/DNA-directed RNA polymerase subunit RPC12/RpoP
MQRDAITGQPDRNIVFVGNTGFEAADDRLIVLQDEFKSGYECARCGDKEHRFKPGIGGQTESVIDCENCNGKGHYQKGEGLSTNTVFCSLCERTGKVPCPDCDGKGSKTIVLAEDQKGRPTTGTVVSVGFGVQRYKLGDRVCYPSFSGHAFDLTGVDPEGKTVERTLVIHIERDILAKVHGTLEKRMVRKSMALHTNS